MSMSKQNIESNGEIPSLAILRDNLKNSELHALQDAGLIQDEQVRRYLQNYKRGYEPNRAPHYENDGQAYYYYNAEEYVQTVEEELNRVLGNAVANGNYSIIEHAIGLQKSGNFDMDIVEFEKLSNFLENNSLQLACIGDTGDGKTVTLGKLCEMMMAKSEFDVLLINLKSVAENNENVIFIETLVDYVEYCIEHPHERKILALDELNQIASGYSGDAADVEDLLRTFLNKKRKPPFKTSLLGTTQRIGELHPVIRDPTKCNYLVKEGETQEERQQTFTIYKYVTDSGKFDGAKMTIENLNKPKQYQIDTYDSGNFTWYHTSEDEILELAYEMRDIGYGDMCNWIRLLEDDDEENDVDGRPLDTIKCNNCGKSAEQFKNQELSPIIDTGYCWDHISQEMEDAYLDNPNEFDVDEFEENNSEYDTTDGEPPELPEGNVEEVGDDNTVDENPTLNEENEEELHKMSDEDLDELFDI